jgi:predicted RecB family nuclease
LSFDTLAKIQACMELGDRAGVEEQDCQVVQGYNRDDCFSTWRLRDWLEGLRSDLIAKGAPKRPA